MRTRNKKLPEPTTWTCPHCGHVHTPATLRRLDSETLQCQGCKRPFAPDTNRPVLQTDDKKERERWLIEQARRLSDVFPPGELSCSESPDWLIPSARLGIEVTELLPPVLRGSFSGPQLSLFQWEVVQMAQRKYCELSQFPANVLVFFNNQWRRKVDRVVLAEALASCVISNYPGLGKSIILDPMTTETWIDDLKIVRITGTGGVWQAGGINDIGLLTYKHLAGRIEAKNKLVKHYRHRLPGWHLWLLLATRLNVLCSVYVPPEITDWRFTFDFDKVVLFDWERGVIKLQRIHATPERQ